MPSLRRRISGLPLIIMLLILLPSIQTYDDFSSRGNQFVKEEKVVLAGDIVHSPISIDGDAAFISQATSESWPGSGIPGNPYRIENYYIDASTEHGIAIAHTQVYFIIYNCTIFGGLSTYNGISLDNVSNATITDNEILSDNIGIYLYNANSNSIENNDVSDCKTGIGIESSDYVTVHNNTCYDNSDLDIGVYYYSRWTAVTNNTCMSTGVRSIYLRETANTTFSHNSMSGRGLDVMSSINLWISFVEFDDNTINGSQILLLQDQVGGDYSGNYAQILLVRCDSVTIHDMVFSRLYQGVILLYCNDTIVKNITCVGCYYGFDITAGYRVTVSDCNASYCDYIGLRVGWGYPQEDNNDHLITNSTFHDNEWGGARVGGEGGITIFNNTLYGNAVNHNDRYNLFVNADKDITIINNTCWDSYDGSIYCTAISSLIANNTCINGGGFGIGLNWADETIVTTNLCKNVALGISITSTNQAYVVNNTLIGNGQGISCGGDSYYNTIAYNNCSFGGWVGISLGSGSNNLVWKNVCNNNTGSGIYLSWADYINTVANNTCSHNIDEGINSHRSSWTVIANNTCEDNSIGLLLDDSTHDDSVYWNLFVDNIENGVDNGADNHITNNYWSNYMGVDTTPADGIGDTPHPIAGGAGNEDPYPLMSPSFVPTLTSWVTAPTDQYVEYNNGFYLDLDTTGPIPLVIWINDTARFSIDSNWVITNTTPIDIGIYGLRVTARNMYGHHLVAEFNVIVQDTTAPVWLLAPADIEIVGLDEMFTFTLNATDLSGISHYWISDWDSFSFTSDDTFTQWDNLPRGNYSLEVRAYDPYGNYASKNFTLSVVDMDPPILNQPEDITTSTNEGFIISWYPADDFPWKYEIFRDGALYESDTWVTYDTISVNLLEDTPGEYNFTVIVYDLDGNSATDTVIVTVVPYEPPPTDTIIDTTPPPPPPFNIAPIILLGAAGVVVVVVVVVLRKRR